MAGLGVAVEKGGGGGEVVVIVSGGERGTEAVVGEAGLGLLDDAVVEAAAEAVVIGDDNGGDLVDGADLGEGDLDILVLELLNLVENLDEGLGVGEATDDGLLGTADHGSGDELHGLGDLLGVLHTVDALSKLVEAAVRGGRGYMVKGG